MIGLAVVLLRYCALLYSLSCFFSIFLPSCLSSLSSLLDFSMHGVSSIHHFFLLLIKIATVPSYPSIYTPLL